MPIRLGIELSPTACRIVEIERNRRVRAESLETRLISFSVTRRLDPEISTQLKDYRGRRATVVVWAPGADHRPVVVVNASYGQMRTEARSAVRAAGRTADRMLADIAPVPLDLPADEPEPYRRVVLVATAPTDEISTMLEPLIQAGIRVEHVLTPAAALVSLARLRRPFALPAPSERERAEGSERSESKGPDALEAYVALDESAGAVAIIRNGLLVAATRLDWGFVDEVAGRRALRPRQDVVTRLADDISEFLYEGGLDSERVQHVCVASGVPDLRSIAMLMMERFDVEVEPLDSLYGIEADCLQRRETECREVVPLLRLAWAAAADDRPPLDLMRPRQWAMRQQNLSRAAVTAGMVVGLTLGWSIQGQVNADPAPDVRPARAESAIPFVLPSASLPAAAMTVTSPPPTLAASESEVSPPEMPARPVFRVMKEPEAAPKIEPQTAASRPIAAVVPPDVTVESILFSSDRRLAIVDGRIMTIGDSVGGFRIVDITPTTVVVADGRGRLVQVAAGRRAR